MIEGQFGRLTEEINGFAEDYILNAGESELTTYLAEKYSIVPPRLDEAGITVDQQEISEEVQGDYGRNYVRKGILHYFHIPYSGEEELFKAQASTSSSWHPQGAARNGELTVTITSFGDTAEKIKSEFERDLQSIRDHLSWIDNDLKGFDQRLSDEIGRLISSRKSQVLANKDLVADLGYPMRERAGTSKTYSTPDVRRKPQVRRPRPQASAPFKPEPALNTDDYEHILQVTDNMVSVIEKSPSAFIGMNEENLRQHFLVQLNGQYEGNATGETFNFHGKTDILIKSEGRNIFIAECKFWNGSKTLVDTISQILGYSSWRDTKTAIFLFNRNKNLTAVVEKIEPAIAEHPNFIRFVDYDRETGWRAIFSHTDDSNRELTITIHVYEVPIE